MLAVFLKHFPGRIVVMGENDRRVPKPLPNLPPHPVIGCTGCQRCWPGKYGADAIAKVLRRKMRRRWSVVRMPPDGAKDLRTWFNAASPNPRNEKVCLAAGREFLRRIEAHKVR